jgi:hypothetical protein
MDTNSNIRQLKRITDVEILNLDVLGYGPQGQHTRREWRKECLDNLLAGNIQFDAWQASWKDQINEELPRVNFGVVICFSDNSMLTQAHDGELPYTLDFSGHSFDDSLDCRAYTFQQTVLFSSAIFNGPAAFSIATFNGRSVFRYATFNGMTDFGASFNHSADFFSTSFSMYASFYCATFSNAGVYFNNVTFSGGASFHSAKFSGKAYFFLATFSELAAFGGAEFVGDVNFQLATFDRQCHFENSFDEQNKVWTKETSFASKVEFENAVFKNVGHFERVRFKKHTPAFRGCQIDNTRLEFSDDSYFPNDESTEDAIKNISFLKRLSDEHGQTDQALNFNAMELRAKRLQTAPQVATWSFKVVTWLYEKISNYGRSFTRPLLVYLSIFIITYFLAILFAANNSPIKCTEQMLQYNGDIQSDSPVSCLSYSIPQTDPAKDDLKLTGYRAAFEYAAYRASGIFDFSDNGKATDVVTKRVFGTAIEPWWMRVWGIFKSFASIALLFLAALGLRNKYRIK